MPSVMGTCGARRKSKEMSMVRVEFIREAEAVGLPLPAYETEGAAGMDLRAALPEAEPIALAPYARALVTTGLRVLIPAGYEGQVRARSGLALRHGLGLVNAPGTIDSDYRGVLQVLLINWGTEPVVITRGDRIAQLVIAPVIRAIIVERTAFDPVHETARGTGGFGSTGVQQPTD